VNETLISDRFPAWNLIPNPAHIGPREDWFCACTLASGQGKALRGWMQNHCSICKVAAPWMTWERKDVGV
jgi:hypothetical protein